MNQFGRAIKIASMNMLVFMVLLVLVELFFGGWLFKKNNLSNLGILKNVNRTYYQELYESDNPIVHYTRDQFGLRGLSILNRPDKISILTVGGSTTDQRYIDDTKTWQQILEKLLNENGENWAVANAGVDGQSTIGHIKNFEMWFPAIENLNPKFIIFYVGLNDFARLHDKSEFDKISVKDYEGWRRVIETIKINSTLYHLGRKLKGIYLANKFEVGHQKIDFSKYTYTDKKKGSKDIYTIYQSYLDSVFQPRIQKLIRYTHKVNANPIFVTQPSAVYHFRNDSTLIGRTDFSYINGMPLNGVDQYYLLKMMNATIMKMCQSSCQVIELTTLPIWNRSDFYDWNHMTPQGTRKVALEIKKQIRLNL